MLGTFAVGKTSLVRRFVKGIFSEKYLTTMGAKVDKKPVEIDGEIVDLMLWDLNGEDRFQKLSMDYVQGAAGYLLVIDSTRRASFEAAYHLRQKVVESIGEVPFVVVFNKSDLNAPWENQDRELQQLQELGWTVMHTSAKTGTGVEEVFETLTKMILHK